RAVCASATAQRQHRRRLRSNHPRRRCHFVPWRVVGQATREVTGAALAMPAAAVGAFVAYQSHFRATLPARNYATTSSLSWALDRTTKKAAKMNVERAPTRNCWLRKR